MWRPRRLVASAMRPFRSGAGYEMARLLVDAGLPDQPVRIEQAGIAGCVTFPSLHWLAKRHIEGGRTSPIKDRLWNPLKFCEQTPQNRGMSAPVVDEQPPDALGPCFAATGDAM